MDNSTNAETGTTPYLKRCSECGVEHPATLEFFYSDKRIKSGLKAACKTCSNKRLRNFRQDNPEKIKDCTLRYSIPRRDQLSKKTSRWARNNPVKKIAQAKRYAKRNPEKIKAHHAVSYAVRTGKLAPVASQKCSHNGDRCRQQASEYHHYLGYSEEHWLDVIPLCAVCHRHVERNK